MFNVKLNKIKQRIYEIGLFGLFLLLLVILLPFQTRKAFFLPETHISSVYLFYNAGFVYLTDLILIMTLLFAIFKWYKGSFHMKHNENRVIFISLGTYLIVSGISLLNVSHETLIVAVLAFTKLLLCVIFLCFMINISSVKRLFHAIFWLILATSIVQSIIGIAQYFYQRSIGLMILGEEVIRPYLGGIAKFQLKKTTLWTIDQIFGVSRQTSDIVRPYGTFPHPNLYGSFLFMSSIVTCYLIYVSRGTKKTWVLYPVLVLQIFAASISFSRVAISSWGIALLTVLVLVVISFIRNKSEQDRGENVAHETKIDFSRIKKIALAIVLSSVLVSGLFYTQFLERTGAVSYGTTNEKSISERALYVKISWSMIRANPLSGVGYQNFVQAMDRYTPQDLLPHQHQPVHNIYLLVASEIGLLGLAAFLLFIYWVLRRVIRSELSLSTIVLAGIFVGFLFIGIFDHYLLTIQQGRLMFFLVAGLLIISTQKQITPR